LRVGVDLIEVVRVQRASIVTVSDFSWLFHPGELDYCGAG